ncbi:hypothetical protein N7456_005002 [Penicillium angulare]|uniref:Xylanolytic transcriptional activator regulatory domain-containing protein n=1 Tax=Penicillium angulare TaxID=116970 RepID=A0A9W9FXN9_9EURO|nr:hypothetical protein N7456_005002 [Penicillium angulare]
MRNRQRPLKFIASDADGFPQSRRKAHRACVQCRRRKRRCTHGVSASRQLEIEAQSHEEICPPARNPSSPLANIQDGVIISPISSMGTVRENDQHLSPEACIDGEAWFVGDLDPEGAFLVAASPASSSRANRRHGDVGVWLSAKNAYTQLAAKKPTSSLMSCLDPFLSSVILPNLESQCLGVLPAPDDMKELLHIYLTNIHPMFPVLDLETYENMPTTSPERIILSQSICIAAALHQDATPYLRLPTVDSSFDFSRSLLDAINASVALGLAKDKLVLIQAFSLASLFTQFSGNRQESAELLSRAICHTYTIGIHHHCPSSMQKEQTLTRIFCCLYALDILTAAFLGRPMQFHRRDTNRDILSSIAAQDSCFQLLLRTILVLERVIELYQPAVNSTWKEEFPPFEDLLQEVDTSDIPLHFIGMFFQITRWST